MTKEKVGTATRVLVLDMSAKTNVKSIKLLEEKVLPVAKWTWKKDTELWIQPERLGSIILDNENLEFIEAMSNLCIKRI